MSQIFISYARADRDIAGRIAEYLQANGLNVWWDHDLEPGAVFSVELRQRLNDASHVLVLWSKSSINSHFVLDEATQARGQNKLIPLRIDSCELPLGFGQQHVHDLRRLPDDLVPVVVKLGAPAPVVKPQLKKKVASGTRVASVAISGTMLAVVLGTGGFLYHRQLRDAEGEGQRAAEVQSQSTATKKSEAEKIGPAAREAAGKQEEAATKNAKDRQAAAKDTARIEAERRSAELKREQERREQAQRDALWLDCRQPGNPELITRGCNEIIALDGTAAEAYFLRAMAAQRKSDRSKASADLEQVIRLVPADARAYVARGHLAMAKGDTDAAASACSKAVELDGKSAYALVCRAATFAARQDIEHALEDVTAAVTLDAHNAAAYEARGKYLRARGANDRAIADFNEAIKIDPSFSAAYSGRAAVLAAQGNADRAFVDYGTALRTSAVLVGLSLVILAATSHLLGGLVLPGARRR